MTETHISNGNYRLLLAAFLPPSLAEPLQTIRRQHSTGSDPHTPPHVTLVRSFWRRGPATPENEAELLARLQAAQERISPFELKLSGIGAFHDPKRVIYLKVEPTSGLLEARRTLLEAIGLKDKRPFTPHVTLAKGLDLDKFETLLAQLEQSEWHTKRWLVWVERLRLMQREVDENEMLSRGYLTLQGPDCQGFRPVIVK